MRFAKVVDGSNVRFCRVKRRGTKNCRIVWLDTNEEQLMPMSDVTECSAIDAGAATAPPVVEGEDICLAPNDGYPTQITGEDLCRLMKEHQVSVKELATYLNVSTERIREARANGIDDPLNALKWITMIENARA